MADDNPDILSVGVEDDGSLQATVDAAQKALQQLGDTGANAFARVNDSAEQLARTFNEIDASTADLAKEFSSAALQSEIDGMLRLSDATAGVNAQLNATADVVARVNSSLAQGLSSSNNFNLGYGVPGGGIGPAADDSGDDGSDGGIGGGGSGGSLFAAAHGIRAASGLASLAGAGGATGAFTGTADILYLTQGLKQIGGIVTDLNASIEATPSLLSGVTDGMVALGVPLAGLLTVAAPVALAIGLVATGFEIFKETVKGVNDVLATTADSLKTRFSAEQNDTTAQIQSSLDKAKRDKATADAEIKQIQDANSGAFAAAQQALPGGDLTARISFLLGSTQSGFQEVGKALDDAQKRSNAAAADIQGYSDALGTSSVAVNDANAAVIASITANKAQADQFAADDQLTTDAVQKKIDKLKEETPTLEANVASLEKQLDIAKQAGVNTDNLSAALDTAKSALSGTTAELQHLADVSLEVATRTAAQADAAKVSQQLIDDKAKFDAADADRRTNFQATQANQLADFNAKQQAETDAFYQARDEKTQNFNAQLGEIQTKATAARLKEEQSYQVASQRAQEDYERSLADIQTKSKSQLLKDAANLDANAVQNDLDSAAQQKNTLTENFNIAQQRRAEDEQTKLNEITTNANAETAQRNAAFSLSQQQELTNYQNKQTAEKTAFDAQQKQETDNFTRTESQQAASFKRQQDALTAKLEADEVAIVASYVRQAALAFVGGFNTGTAASNGMAATYPLATQAGTTIGTTIANAAVAAAAEAIASAPHPFAGTPGTPSNYGGAVAGDFFGGSSSSPQDYGLIPNTFSNGTIDTSGGGFGDVGGGAYFGGNSSLGINGLGGGFYGGMADGGYIPAGGVGWVGNEFVRAGTGGASVTPAGATEPKGKRSFTLNGNIVLNSKPAPAELQSLVFTAMEAYFEQDQ